MFSRVFAERALQCFPSLIVDHFDMHQESALLLGHVIALLTGMSPYVEMDPPDVALHDVLSFHEAGAEVAFVVPSLETVFGKEVVDIRGWIS